MHDLMGAADVVVSRAGATTIAELAALGKAVILVPFGRLPGGHQTKNAEKLLALGAVAVVSDEEMVRKPSALLEEIRHLVRAPRERQTMADKLHSEAKPDAAERLAEILIEVGENTEKERAEKKKDGAKLVKVEPKMPEELEKKLKAEQREAAREAKELDEAMKRWKNEKQE